MKRNGTIKGQERPRRQMNAFKHGLAAIQKRREERITTEQEESVRQQIICGSDLSAAIHFAGRVKGGTSLPLEGETKPFPRLSLLNRTDSPTASWPGMYCAYSSPRFAHM
jgi:hypothetical protein